MTFNPNIPQPNDIISSSQPQILTNFTQLNTLFGIDHVEYDNATALNRGKHKKITFVPQAADPTTAALELAIYTKNVGGPGLFIREQSNGAVYKLSGPTPSAAASGYTWLPGSILLQWGNQAATAANPVTFPIAFTTCYQVIGSTNANDRAFAVTAISAANFTFSVLNPSPAVTIRWMAIGTQ